MPYSIRKLPNKELYRVYNTKTKEVHSYSTTLENANKQINLLLSKYSKKKIEGGTLNQPKLLEIFKGTGSVGKVASKMGFSVISLDLDPIYTPDIETDILDWDYKKYYNETKYTPDMIWASPPCNTFSQMVYRLKERDTKTAKPFSDRAKLGTKILYKTIEIIEFFKSKNPKMLFIIENPRGMMRMDEKMKQFTRETTLYCLYGDFKRKSTDFWTNFPNGLKLNQEDKQCSNKTIPVQDLKTIEERYSMPSKLIKHFLDEFKSQYLKEGGSIETDNFENEGIVSLPEFRSINIDLPTYMYKRLPDINGKPPPYRYKLVVPITSSRNLSSRKKFVSLNISQKPVSKPIVDISESEEQPTLDDFSNSDKEKIQAYYYKVKENEKKKPNEINKDSYEIKERGRPLPCLGVARPKKPKPVKVRKVKEVKIPKPLGRPNRPVIYEVAEDEDLFANPVEDNASVSSTSSFGGFDPTAELKKVLKGKGLENKIFANNNNKMPNRWIEYVKAYAAKNGISYRDALKDPNCKGGYKKGGMVEDDAEMVEIEENKPYDYETNEELYEMTKKDDEKRLMAINKKALLKRLRDESTEKSNKK